MSTDMLQGGAGRNRESRERQRYIRIYGNRDHDENRDRRKKGRETNGSVNDRDGKRKSFSNINVDEQATE